MVVSSWFPLPPHPPATSSPRICLSNTKSVGCAYHSASRWGDCVGERLCRALAMVTSALVPVCVESLNPPTPPLGTYPCLLVEV